MKLKRMLEQAGLPVVAWFEKPELSPKEKNLAKRVITQLGNDHDTIIAFCIELLSQSVPEVVNKIGPILSKEYQEHFPVSW